MATEVSQNHTEAVTAAEMDQYSNFQALLSIEKVEEVESSFHSFGPARRITLGVLSLDADKLSSCSLEDPDTYDQMTDQVAQFREHVKHLTAVVELAESRLFIADVRPNAAPANRKAKRKVTSARGRAGAKE